MTSHPIDSQISNAYALAPTLAFTKGVIYDAAKF